MNFKKILILCLPFSSLFGEDPELTNYRSGISLEWLGEKGVDYMEEYMYFDKRICDWKVVYIKDSTLIRMSHNERNIAGDDGGSDKYEAVDETVGQIRFKADGDHHWGKTPARWDSYLEPFSFSTLDYALYGEPETPVVGSTGYNEFELSPDNKTKTFHKGMVGPFGDEWHTLTVADDDSQRTDNPEFLSSDGKVFFIVVNPKTPALTVRTSGNGEFYTTPAKKYFIPLIYEQTTYIDEREGAVTFEITDLNGNKVFYRINGGEFTSNGTPSVTLDHKSFNEGKNSLEYYFEGNEGFVKTRTVLRRPIHPSLIENHGDKLWINARFWDADVKPRLFGNVEGSKVLREFWDNWRTTELKDSSYFTGKRSRRGGMENALVARFYGNNFKYRKNTNTFAHYAKLDLFHSLAIIDPVGAELNHSNAPVPSREVFYRGYYDVKPIMENAAVYDILTGYYRTDQGHSKGISPVEDFFIRDVLARWVHISSLFIAGYNDPIYGNYDSGGMWETSRNVGAAMITALMPSYSTPYFGTSGMDGNTTTYPWTPFRDTHHTWKEIFFDNDLPMERPGFPNVHKRMGIVDYMVNADGNFQDRKGYTTTDKMGHVIGIYYNLKKLFTPEVSEPHLDALQVRAASGTLYGLKSINAEDKLPASRVFACWQNAWFPEFNAVARPIMLATTSTTSDNFIKKQIQRGGPFYAIWFDHQLPVPVFPNGDPSNLDTSETTQASNTSP